MNSTSVYPPNPLSHAAVSAHRNSSPQSISASTASTVYTPHLTTSSLSPHVKVSAGLDVSAGHGLPVSQRAPSGHNMTNWGSNHQMQYPGNLSQGGRTSWGDYAYINASAAAVLPSAAQSLQRSDQQTDMSQMSADNTYQHFGERTTRV